MLLLLMNVPILPCYCYTGSKKLVDVAWKVTNHGKDEGVVSDVVSSCPNDGECVMKSSIAPVPKFVSSTPVLACDLMR